MKRLNKLTMKILFLTAILSFFACPQQQPEETIACGNSIVEDTETCDDGNTVTEACAYGETACTVCNSACQSVAGAVSYCGDNNKDTTNGEECDDGNTTDDLNGCTGACIANNNCGNGVLEDAVEQCDNGGTDIDGCTNLCQSAIYVTVTGAAANKQIAMSVIEEDTKNKIYYLFFDPDTGEYADAAGVFTKNITGLTTGYTYSIMVKSDVDGGSFVDTNDSGKLMTGVTAESVVTLDILQALSTMAPSAATDLSLADKMAFCFTSTVDYAVADLMNDELGILGRFLLIYNNDGTLFLEQPDNMPPGTYGNILCIADMDGNMETSAGDKYQIINGPFTLTVGDDTKTFTIGAWQTY